VPYADKKDTRIPKYALKITFWAPGIEQHEKKGGDWTKYPGIRTVIATSASGSISVNGVELRKESANGEAALFGRLYTGDVITILQNKECFLRFVVEITFGDGARPRPDSQKGFVVEEERHHHQRVMKERSMRVSN
jgi:hypothetical protein